MSSGTLLRRACRTRDNCTVAAGQDVGCGDELDPPHALPTIATVLLENARTCGLKPCSGRLRGMRPRCGRDGCRCPSPDASCDGELPSHPSLRITSGSALTQMPLDATSRNIASSVGPVFLLLGNRIDPDEHADRHSEAVLAPRLPSHLHRPRVPRKFRSWRVLRRRA